MVEIFPGWFVKLGAGPAFPPFYTQPVFARCENSLPAILGDKAKIPILMARR